MLKPSLKWTAAAVALVVLLALPVAASQEEGAQELTAQEKEILAKVKAEVEAAMAEMKESLAKMKEELAAMQEHKVVLRDFDAKLEDLEIDKEAIAREMKFAREEAMKALDMAKIEAEMAARRLPEMYFAAEAPHIWSWRTAEYGSFVLDLSEKLALTDTQQGQIRDLQREHKRQTIERRADLEVAELDLKTLQSAETLDLEAIRDQLEVVSGLKIEEQIAGLQLKHDIQQVLTLEQKDQLEEIDKKFGPRKVSVLKRKR